MRKSLVAATALAALALSACGGGGNSASPSDTTDTATASATASAVITSTVKPTTIAGSATFDANKVKATATMTRNKSVAALVSHTIAPPIPKNSATIVQKPNSQFGSPQVLIVPINDDGTQTAKAQVSLAQPTNFKPLQLAFPEFGSGKDPSAPTDRALKFNVTIKNTTTKAIYFGDVKIIGTTNSKAPACRDLLGDDTPAGGKTVLAGPTDEDGNALTLAAGKSVTFDYGLVCQAAKGAKMSLSFQVGTAAPRVYNLQMP